MDSRIIDKRVAKRNINKGLLSKEEYDRYIAALPDLANACEEVTEKLFGAAETEEETSESSETNAEV